MWRPSPQASISWDVVPPSRTGHRSGERIVGAAALQVADILPAQLPSSEKFLHDSFPYVGSQKEKIFLQDALKSRNPNPNPLPSLVKNETDDEKALLRNDTLGLRFEPCACLGPVWDCLGPVSECFGPVSGCLGPVLRCLGAVMAFVALSSPS